jgi:hypothetical protein
MDVVAKRSRVILLASALGIALTGSALSAPSTRSFRGNCGPVLCIPTGPGWFGSVGPGFVDRRPAAWLMAGNFRFPADAAEHEGTPSVPPGRLLIVISDSPPVGASVHWPQVKQLGLPPRRAGRRVITRHVRFAGRAVGLSVHFGSTPSAADWRLANARLSAIHRKRS